ncbi:MAG: acylneuraminate cytidylyltransferase family protein [Bacteriovoracaceae bacterium]|nr:acylneuraminate cytidylyltransferase family protein [Bacteriovoracaceae bacterium]
MTQTVAIIPARGGSKGIPKKNLIPFCGKPLIAWSIEQAVSASHIDSVWVTSDDEEILSVAQSYGANPILRPNDISGDGASSESAWIHAVDDIRNKGIDIDLAIGIQATSPLREAKDLDLAIEKFRNDQLDSLFSASLIEDFFIWEEDDDGNLKSQNYDHLNRKRRQDIKPQYVENGSFYLFKPDDISKFDNRLSGKIGFSIMEFWKTFEIDSMEDLEFCEALMKHYLT